MPEPFKNLINPEVARSLGKLMLGTYSSFDYEGFLAHSLPRLEALELKDRARLLGEALRRSLPADPGEAISIVTRAIRQLPALSEDRKQSGWILFPINAFLAKHGLDAYEESVELLRETTRRFTAEFGIRPFLIKEPERTLRILAEWADDPDQHVRRLVSEGTRPRLPWAEQIPALIRDPSPLVALLDRLKDDPEEYVRRSVANNLNDISKDHPDLMLDVVERWQIDASPARRRLIKHACRTLVKSGNTRCLTLLGYAPARLAVENFRPSAARVTLGEKLQLSCALRSTADDLQNLIVDYRFHFVKANGRATPKVFKGSLVALDARASKELRFSLHLRAVTTRAYYSGETRVELFVNGAAIAETSFDLSVPECPTRAR